MSQQRDSQGGEIPKVLPEIPKVLPEIPAEISNETLNQQRTSLGGEVEIAEALDEISPTAITELLPTIGKRRSARPKIEGNLLPSACAESGAFSSPETDIPSH